MNNVEFYNSIKITILKGKCLGLKTKKYHTKMGSPDFSVITSPLFN